MTEATPPAQQPTAAFSAIRNRLAGHPTAVAVTLYALFAVGAAVSAYFTIFTQFAIYDDEGTLLTTVNSFAHGGVLYRDIYSGYGPFYYEVFGGLFKLAGQSITTDSSRSIVIVIWVATSLLMGLACQQLTKRLALGLAGAIVSFSALIVLANEPMHPQGLCVLLLAAFVYLAVSDSTQGVRSIGLGAGILLAALTLTKVNVGAFAVAATAVAAALTVEQMARRAWLRWLAIGLLVATPIFVCARDLDEAWVRDLVMVELFAIVAVLIAWAPNRTRAGEGTPELARGVWKAVVGFVVAFAVIVGIALATGPTPHDIYQGVIGNALKVRDVLVTPLPLPGAAVDWAVMAVAAATLTFLLRRPPSDRPSPWPGLLRAAAGLIIWANVARVIPVALGPSPANPDTLPLVLAWVAAMPLPGVRETPQRRFLRLLLPLLAVVLTLQVYPVAGSQMGIASFTFVPVGALCLADALASLRVWAQAREPGGAVAELAVATGVVTVAIAGVLALDTIVRPAASGFGAYRDRPALDVPGGGMLHLEPPQGENYAAVVDLIKEHGCTAFAGYPSINSFYIWTGIEPPAPQVPNAWMDGLDREQQQRIVDSLRASPQPCAIRSDELAELWLRGRPAPQLPLVRYIFDEFETVAEVGEFEFMLPKEAN